MENEYCPNGITGCCNCEQQPQCVTGTKVCKAECKCGFGFFECDTNGYWQQMPIPEGTICLQVEDDIELVHSCIETGDIKECVNRNTNCNCNFDGGQHHDNDERCIEECKCGSGYEVYLNHRWIHMPSPRNATKYILENKVCVQNGTHVYFEASCPEFGVQRSCVGRITGECGCRDDTHSIERK